MVICSSIMLLSFVIATHHKTVITDIIRVIMRLNQTGTFIWIKPSIIICPVSVPVIVEFCPEANKATMNSTDKIPELET